MGKCFCIYTAHIRTLESFRSYSTALKVTMCAADFRENTANDEQVSLCLLKSRAKKGHRVVLCIVHIDMAILSVRIYSLVFCMLPDEYACTLRLYSKLY